MRHVWKKKDSKCSNHNGTEEVFYFKKNHESNTMCLYNKLQNENYTGKNSQEICNKQVFFSGELEHLYKSRSNKNELNLMIFPSQS